MAKNKRCPLQGECEKACEFERHELDCAYYELNAREEMSIEDQEEIRAERDRKRQAEWDEQFYAADDKPKIVYLPLEQLHPHPENPRRELGDLTEMAEYIRAKGVLQNLTVVPGHWMTTEEWQKISAEYEANPTEELRALMNGKWLDTEYTVIIGHRRRGGAKLAGLTEVPCVIVEMTRKEQLETMLLENMQREDLTPYEQARGFQLMIDLGDTVEGIVEKTGFSRTTVKRRLEMARLDQQVLKQVSDRQISMDDFDKLAKIEDISKRNKVLKEIGTNNFASECQSAIDNQQIKKNIPLAKDLAKKREATKISKSDTWGSEYTKIGNTIYLKSWDGKDPIPENETRKLFYVLAVDWGELSFYIKTPRAKPQKKPKAVLDKEQRMKDANKELKKLNDLHYQLRKDFVAQLSLKNKLALLQAAVFACAASGAFYLSADRASIFEILSLETNYYGEDKGQKLVAAFDNVDPSKYPQLIYARMEDVPALSYGTTYSNQFPKYKGSYQLDLIYTWLRLMGYQMSDDEIALMQGTHPIFRCDDKK